MQFSKIFLKIIIHNQKSIVKDIRLTPLKKTVFSKSDNKKRICTYRKTVYANPLLNIIYHFCEVKPINIIVSQAFFRNSGKIRCPQNYPCNKTDSVLNLPLQHCH